MTKTLTAVLLVAVFLAPSYARASNIKEESAALLAFQPIVKKYTEFFQKNPKLLSKVSPPQRQDLKAYSIAHFRLRNLYYDIQKTNSIVSPYDAFIDIDTDVADNKRCGKVSFDGKTPEGWAKAEEARANANNEQCFVIRTNETAPIKHRFHFQYQRRTGTWQLYNITYSDGSVNGRFMALLGVASPWFPPVTEPAALDYNKGWTALFRGQ